MKPRGVFEKCQIVNNGGLVFKSDSWTPEGLWLKNLPFIKSFFNGIAIACKLRQSKANDEDFSNAAYPICFFVCIE